MVCSQRLVHVLVRFDECAKILFDWTMEIFVELVRSAAIQAFYRWKCGFETDLFYFSSHRN